MENNFWNIVYIINNYIKLEFLIILIYSFINYIIYSFNIFHFN